ncbi:DUF3168 domain-containing protein [Pinisolibacter sp.]|uniref:DUF3168 domain-containing protein n=1 Tax=Pinisolibacter sp. TaxID=2172024 RepID=UPI002FDE7E09
MALQTLVRARLIASPDLVALVPADHVLDKNDRPEVFPCILIGEGQTLPDEGLARDRFAVTLDVHVWAEEPGLATVKTIAHAVRQALVLPFVILRFHVVDLRIASTRFMRDPAGYGHAVVTVEAPMKEIVP